VCAIKRIYLEPTMVLSLIKRGHDMKAAAASGHGVKARPEDT